MKVKLAALEQKIDDFKESVMFELKEIKEQTKKTNGNVAKAIIDIALLKQENDNSPARLAYGSEVQRKDWSLKMIVIILTIVTIIINAVFFIITKK